MQQIYLLKGLTPLHFATRYRSANIVSELLKFGANVNDKTNEGFDVYDMAKYNKNERENVLSVLVTHKME